MFGYSHKRRCASAPLVLRRQIVMCDCLDVTGSLSSTSVSSVCVTWRAAAFSTSTCESATGSTRLPTRSTGRTTCPCLRWGKEISTQIYKYTDVSVYTHLAALPYARQSSSHTHANVCFHMYWANKGNLIHTDIHAYTPTPSQTATSAHFLPSWCAVMMPHSRVINEVLSLFQNHYGDLPQPLFLSLWENI